ncbi:WD40 repeat-like protein [Podospora conica]|nr:WD40 repeat-like protein [Schizothecium conicum]
MPPPAPPPTPPASFPSTPIAQLLGSNGPIHAITYSTPPSPYILTGSSDRLIRLYNPSTTTPIPPPNPNSITPTPSPSPTTPPSARLITTFPPLHSHPITSLSISPTNSLILSSGGDRTLFLWDVATLQSTRRFHGHIGRINTVTFSGASGDSLAVSGGLDATVRVWDLRSGSGGGGKAVQVMSEAKDAVTSVICTSHEIVAGSVDGRVRGYDVRMGRVVTDVIGASVTSLSLSPGGGETVLVGGLDSKVRLMDRRDGVCLKTYQAQGWRNEGVRVQSCFGGGGRWVVAGDEFPPEGEAGEGRVWAWDVMTGGVVARLGVPWGAGGRGKVVGRDGREKGRRNVVSCVAWKEGGPGGGGEQFCVGGTSGVGTVFGVGTGR